MRSSGARGIYKRGTSTYRKNFYRPKTPFLRDAFFDLGQYFFKDEVRTIDRKEIVLVALLLLAGGGFDGDPLT